MSDINIFDDPKKVPQPKDSIRIESIEADPYPDRYRVFTKIVVTAFRERPNLILFVRDATGKIINEMNVIATMHSEMEFTIHMRGLADPAGDYTLEVELFYETRKPPQHKMSIPFTIPPAAE